MISMTSGTSEQCMLPYGHAAHGLHYFHGLHDIPALCMCRQLQHTEKHEALLYDSLAGWKQARLSRQLPALSLRPSCSQATPGAGCWIWSAGQLACRPCPLSHIEPRQPSGMNSPDTDSPWERGLPFDVFPAAAQPFGALSAAQLMLPLQWPLLLLTAAAATAAIGRCRRSDLR